MTAPVPHFPYYSPKPQEPPSPGASAATASPRSAERSQLRPFLIAADLEHFTNDLAALGYLSELDLLSSSDLELEALLSDLQPKMEPRETRRFMVAVLSAKKAAGHHSSTVDDRSWLMPLAQGRLRGEPEPGPKPGAGVTQRLAEIRVGRASPSSDRSAGGRRIEAWLNEVAPPSLLNPTYLYEPGALGRILDSRRGLTALPTPDQPPLPAVQFVAVAAAPVALSLAAAPPPPPSFTRIDDDRDSATDSEDSGVDDPSTWSMPAAKTSSVSTHAISTTT